MKVLVVHPGPNYSVADVYNGLVKGLRGNGCDVGVLNLDDRIEFYSRAHVAQDDGSFVKAFDENAAYEMAAKGLEVVLYEWWPDVVVVVSGFFIPPKIWAVLKMRTHHVVYWATESPYEDDKQAQPARYADTVVLNDPTHLGRFRTEVNPNSHYFPHSYDPDVHHPGTGTPTRDFTFIGTGFHSRIEWLERVDWTGINAGLGGNWEAVDDDSPLLPLLMHERGQCVDNSTTADLYRASKTSLNLYRKEHTEQAHADGWAMGPREVELAACGTFFFREQRPEGDALFPMLPTVVDPEDFGDQLRWWLAHDRQRNAAALKARAAIADRTFKNTAARLLGVVESAPRKLVA